MAVSIYLLLNENKLMRNGKKLVLSKSKIIGEKPRHDFTPYELQRQRINSEGSFRFENTDTHTVYELDEEELEHLAQQLSDLKSVNNLESMPVDVAGERKKEYYEIDGYQENSN